MSKAEPDFTGIRIKKTSRVDLLGFREYPKQPDWEVIEKLIKFRRDHANCPSEPPKEVPEASHATTPPE